MDYIKKSWDKIDKVLHKIEAASLVFLLATIIILSFTQVIIRLFRIPHLRIFESFDAIIKYSVLWICFIAAGMATAKNKHIKIDLVGKFAHGRLKSVLLAFTNIVAGIISSIIFYSSILYITKIEMNASDPPPFFNIPRWILLLIIPIGFGLVAIRFFIKGMNKISNFIKNHEDEDVEESTEL